jgi:AmmeMemoRadiSam system protein A
MNAPAGTLTTSEQSTLLRLARRAIVEFLDSGRTPAVNEAELSPALWTPRGCFVTLHARGQLRGCIGTLQAREPLFRAVMLNACGAAFRDNRFEPVLSDEVPGLSIHISVLTEPTALSFQSPEELLAQLRPGVDGVVLSMDGNIATFLPQVWEQLPEPTRFMDSLAHKAMLPAAAWRRPEALVLTYQAESFTES